MAINHYVHTGWLVKWSIRPPTYHYKGLKESYINHVLLSFLSTFLMRKQKKILYILAGEVLTKYH